MVAQLRAAADLFSALSGDELAVALEDWSVTAGDTTYAMLERNPDAHAGERAIFQGTIEEIHDLPGGGTMLRLSTASYSRNVLWVETLGSCAADPHLVAGSRARVYGALAGAHSYSTQAGWTMTIPAFVAIAVVPASVPRHVSASVRRRVEAAP